MCGGVSLLSYLVPWSLQSTKPLFQSQCVLSRSCNVTLCPHYPSSELIYSTQAKVAPRNSFSAYQGELSLRTCSLPSADNNQLLKNTNYTKLFTLPLGHLEGLCFCTAHQEVWARGLDKEAFKKLLPPGNYHQNFTFTNVNSFTIADWQNSQMLLGKGNEKRRGTRFLALNGKSGFSPTSWHVLRFQNVPW